MVLTYVDVLDLSAFDFLMSLDHIERIQRGLRVFGHLSLAEELYGPIYSRALTELEENGLILENL